MNVKDEERHKDRGDHQHEQRDHEYERSECRGRPLLRVESSRAIAVVYWVHWLAIPRRYGWVST